MCKLLLKFKHAAGLMLVVMAMALFIGPSCFDTTPKPWSFGVMTDTHWSCPSDPEGTNPDGVAASVIKQINAEFIKKGVKFVVQVGDLANATGGANAIASRAAAAQDLYDKEISFFPTRGNHDMYLDSNASISSIQTNFPQTRGLSNTFGTYNFSSPTEVSEELDGISYAFDYGTPWNNASIVVLDNWMTPTKQVNIAGLAGYVYGYSVGDQQSWISERLNKNTRMTRHAFVLAHQNLMPEYHYDCLFTGFVNANIEMQNTFFSSMQDNGVKYYISGHEHFHNRSMVTSPDGQSKVQDIICASAGSKFLYPRRSPEDPNFFDQKYRQMQISQDLYTVGYYIFTVDGPRVTVDYYSDDHGNWQSDALYPTGADPEAPFVNQVTPVFNFVKKETWGYSLNGKEFIIAQGEDYTPVADFYCGTAAKILSGFNGSDTADYWGRQFKKVVNTGWDEGFDRDLKSNVLTIWGMTGLGTDETDVYTLSISYSGNIKHAHKGRLGIAAKDSNNGWVNAVDLNYGGTKKFVKGPWKPGYELGTYGVDTKTNTAWAVINYNAEFAVSQDI